MNLKELKSIIDLAYTHTYSYNNDKSVDVDICVDIKGKLHSLDTKYGIDIENNKIILFPVVVAKKQQS
jgi:hypothetical protein